MGRRTMGFLRLLGLRDARFFFDPTNFFRLTSLGHVFFSFGVRGVVRFTHVFTSRHFKRRTLQRGTMLISRDHYVNGLTTIFVTPIGLGRVFTVVIISFDRSSRLFMRRINLFRAVVGKVMVLQGFGIFGLRVFYRLLAGHVRH